MSGESNPGVVADIVFRPRDPGRFFSAAFLLLWLCGWLVGEVLALIFLGQGLWALLTGRPAAGFNEPVRMMPAMGAGAFLLVWLTLWTLGGVMAIQEFFRLIWAEDRLALKPDALRRLRRRGPFTSLRSLAKNDIRRLFVQPSNTVLMAQVGGNLFELTDLGTPAERTEAAERLRGALGLPNESPFSRPAALPDAWREAVGPRGEQLLVPNPHTRRHQAVFVAVVTGIVWTGLALLSRESLIEPNMWGVILILSALAAWLSRKTFWMFRGREEWRIDQGRLVHQRRMADDVTELHYARALELTESRDSDNDAWYYLHAIELSSPPLARAGKTPVKIKIAHSIHDPTEPRCLGLWLSQQGGVPFHDRVPTEKEKQAELARLKDQLAKSGPLGRLAARLLARESRRR